MKKNIGTVNKWIRIVVGLFLISLVFWGPQTAWGLIGVLPLVTALVGYCPLYVPFKISTRKEEQKAA